MVVILTCPFRDDLLFVSPSLNEDWMDAIQALGVYHRAAYSQCAALTCIVCDIIVHLPDEIELIWWKKWDVVKVLYILARYFALFYVLSYLLVYSLPVPYEVRGFSSSWCFADFLNRDQVLQEPLLMVLHHVGVCLRGCSGWHLKLIRGGQIGTHLPVNAILIFLRMYALHGRTHRAAMFWGSFSVVMVGLHSYGGVWSGITAVKNAVHLPFPGWTGCMTAGGGFQTGVLVASISTVIEGLVYFVATARKLKQHSDPAATNVEAKFTGIQRLSPLSAALFQDGAFWFLAITVLSALLIGFATYQHGLYLLYVTAWIHTIFSCGASHIVLNLRGIAARQEDGSTGSKGHKFWTKPIIFAQGPIPSSSLVHTDESSIPLDSIRDAEGNMVETWRRANK
ncbi:hypothetical protein BKA70DRAFT_778019 [Coprinopsis sp. MPI-PUGE-AT-0042]|nr:hypothetical protein BKA70DRAFT_778019 [Coprinopsis sp. MPI-PUGE-AT-0042]